MLATAGGRELEAPHRVDARAAPGLVIAMYSAPAYRVDVPAMAVARLSINLSDSAVMGHLDGDRSRVFQARRHSLFLTPAGAGAHWSKEQPSRHINVYFDAKALRDHDDAAFDAAPLLNATLPGARPLIQMLAAELAGADAFAAEAADSLARLILVQLARKQLGDSAAAHALGPALLARLVDFVAANLDRRLLVPELAAVVGLPPNRFAQAFVRGTGRSRTSSCSTAGWHAHPNCCAERERRWPAWRPNAASRASST